MLRFKSKTIDKLYCSVNFQEGKVNEQTKIYKPAVLPYVVISDSLYIPGKIIPLILNKCQKKKTKPKSSSRIWQEGCLEL